MFPQLFLKISTSSPKYVGRQNSCRPRKGPSDSLARRQNGASMFGFLEWTHVESRFFFKIWFHILHTGYILETGLNDWLSQRSLESINIGLKEQEEFVTSPTKNQIWPTDISALNPVLHFHIFHYGILWPLKSGAGGIHIESPSNSAIFGRFPLQEAWWTWIFAKSAARQVSAASGRITCALATIWWEPWGCHESKKWRGMSDKRW